MQVEGQHGVCLQTLMATGARVSNAYPTYPGLGNSPLKDGLMPYVLFRRHLKKSKGLPVWDGDASD